MATEISRKQAIEDGLKHYFTGKPCPKGHVALRFVSTRACSECCVERQRAKSQTEGWKNFVNEWNKSNPERWKAYRKKHYEANKEKNLERAKRYKANNKGHVAEYQKRYRQDNLASFLEYNALRRSARKERTPSWLTSEDRERIKTKYLEAKWMTSRTGVKHVVDHFYPMRGDLVSGLHVPANLRVIPERENGKKNVQMPRVDRVAI